VVSGTYISTDRRVAVALAELNRFTSQPGNAAPGKPAIRLSKLTYTPVEVVCGTTRSRRPLYWTSAWADSVVPAAAAAAAPAAQARK
jgi:hypothetical protein